MSIPKHIIVVGAGIIGASIAWHLARGGARVTIVEAGAAGGVATAASFAWINASWGNPEPYFHLRRRAMREWTRLAGEVASIELAWTGGLIWDMPAAELNAFEALHAGWGYDIRRVGLAEAHAIEPNLLQPPETALHVAEEGMVEPVGATLALLAAAERLGARRLVNNAVVALRSRSNRVTGVQLASDIIDADEVVLAAGIATPALANSAGIDVPMETPPGLIVHSKPYEKLLNGLVLAEALHTRQTAEGRIIAGADFGGADPGKDASGTARQLFSALQSMLRGGDRLEFERYTIGHRPTPADGFPVVGRAARTEGLYLAVMHSGITLAPAIGLFAAEEILRGHRDALLAPYGLARFG